MRVSPRSGLVLSATLFVLAQSAPTMAQYEGPRGHYRSDAGFTRDLNGTPCGMNCTRSTQKRWSAYYRHHPRVRRIPSAK